MNSTHQPSHDEIRDLFMAAMDEELTPLDSERLTAHLEGCRDCRQGFERYAGTVRRLRNVPRERAPRGLLGTVQWRLRRQQGGVRARHWRELQRRAPVEVVGAVVLLVAAAVAAAVFFMNAQ